MSSTAASVTGSPTKSRSFRSSSTLQIGPRVTIWCLPESGNADSGFCYRIADQYPEDFKARDDDKYNYRYRGGESYRDVVIRLEPIIMELERGENIIIVTHQAVLRCIYAYYMNVPQEQSPWMEVPLHTLIKLTPKAYGTQEERFRANIPAVSTWRGKGSTAKHQ